ncbi:protein disulfide isomerase, putative [Plasmodium vinckei brucechwatti]|uniref:Protein disulfide isomerase, putative n=1 Tax=Plasmodium vinckei brucechwatti TaxID=119398 RepID=A0A6V7S335_PLAVN|nr:protein disulfide isomerase, putative [Plasmodium vinckei brucechwatti]
MGSYSFIYIFFIIAFFFTPELLKCSIWEGVSDDLAKKVNHLTHEMELQIYSQHTQYCVALFCTHNEIKCKDVYKEFVNAANAIDKEDIVFVYVDTVKLAKTADNFEIKNVPKILIFRDFDPEKGYTFHNKYTKENIIEWLNTIPMPSVEVMEPGDVNKYVEMNKKKGFASIIAYCTKNSKNPDKFVHFGETHKIPNLAIGLTYIDNNEESRIEIANGPGSTIPNNSIKYKDVYKPANNIWTSDSILNFASDYMNQFPIVINYTRKLRHPIKDEIYLYLYNEFGGYTDSTYVEVYDVIQKYKKIKFVFPRKEEITEMFGLEEGNKYICIMDYTDSNIDAAYALLRPRKYVQQLTENIKSKTVEKFIDDFYNNKVPEFRKSEKSVKRLHKQNYQILCSNNFESYVLDPNKLVIVFYHVHGCKECKPLFSFWEKVANYFHLEYPKEDILVATMDAKLNDMFDTSIKVYPSAAIYPKGADKIKRRTHIMFPIKLDTLIDVVEEILEGEDDSDL